VVGRQAEGGVEPHPLALPDDFQVGTVTTEAGQFFGDMPYLLDNHWPAVRFDRAGRAVDRAMEA
jgi:hypothetical protein